MPNEYALYAQVSEKTDSFAYGIVLLELLSNKNGRDSRSMLELELDKADLRELQQQQSARDRNWPPALLASVSVVVERCTLHSEQATQQGDYAGCYSAT